MLIADWIAIALIALFALLGLLLGFGKGLRFFTKGIIGFIISIFICYSLGGFIIKIGFVDNLLVQFRGLFEGKEEWYFKFLLAIRIDIIVYYLALFIVVQIQRIIIVKIVSKVFEIKNVFLEFLNRIFGLVLFCGVLVLFTMIVFQIIYIIGGSSAESFTSMIAGSKLKLDWFYEHNPLAKIVELLFKLELRIPVQA